MTLLSGPMRLPILLSWLLGCAPSVPPKVVDPAVAAQPGDGLTCTDDSDCNPTPATHGHCYCVGDLAGPNAVDRFPDLDGTLATGNCYFGAIGRGDWYCLVRAGKVNLAGIIVE